MTLETEKGKNKRLIPGNLIALAIFSSVILGIFFVSYIRKNQLSTFPVEGYIPQQDDANSWVDALQAGNEELAILYASKIVPDDKPTLPAPDYMHLLQNNKLTLPVFTSPFNHFDYLRWRDAYDIKKIVDTASKKNKEPILYLFQQLLTKKKPTLTKDSISLYEMFQIELGESKDKPFTSIIDIWQKGYASIDELFRLFSAMAYQLNYDVVIVSMYNSSFKLLHILCEIRKNNKSFICDPINNKLWKNMTVEKLIKERKNETNDKGIEELLKKVEYLVYNLPAEAMDYKLFDLQLQKKLRSLNVPGIPNFGHSPRKRMDRYIKLYGKKSQKSRFSYWNFPFQSLKSSTELPQRWHSLNYKNLKDK